MKLQYNPKIMANDGIDAIYLLDEPGSYLHASAQQKLCHKLKELSKDNCVIYCTHSHYLLDPEVIPISTIKIAEKKGENFNIKINSVYEYKSNSKNKNAFQPLYDALQLKPFDLNISGKVVILEGIYDYYSFKMFAGSDLQYLPSVNAESISFYISLLIGWQVNFVALWDNDPEGVKYQNLAIEKFGLEFSDKFLLLPHSNKKAKKTILQTYFESSEFSLLKSKLSLPPNTSFEKVISTLFYHEEKVKIISSMTKTQNNFNIAVSFLKEHFNV